MFSMQFNLPLQSLPLAAAARRGGAENAGAAVAAARRGGAENTGEAGR